MVNFLPLNVRNENSLAAVLSHIDNATQYAENLEPKDPIDDDNFDDFEGVDDFDSVDDFDGVDDDNLNLKYNQLYESNLDNID